MTIASILKKKKENKQKLLNSFELKDVKKSLWLIVLNKELVDDVLIDALKILPANFIIVSGEVFAWNKNIAFSKDILQNSWFDFIVCDDCEDNLMKHLKDWIVPIVFSKHHIVSLLSEFNAAKVEGNAYIFENNALCDIYYAIIRYLENYKFPYDNKALVKNVLDI